MLLKEIADFATLVERRYGKTPIIYATSQSYEAFLDGDRTDYPIWIRNIYNFPKLPDGKEWAFWQYANRGRLHGIDGFVDLNVFNGTSGEFQNFLASGK